MYRALEFVLKETELRQNLVGPGFTPLPTKDNSLERVNIIGEIEAATGFERQFAYIYYQVFLPRGVEFQDIDEYDAIDDQAMKGIGDSENNRRSSYTHVARGRVQLVETQFERVFRFCFPIDLQVLQPVKNTEKIFEEGDNQDQEDEQEMRKVREARQQLHSAYILMQVNSVDSWKRHRIQGYGFCQIPATAGVYKFNIQTWRPIGTLYEKVYSFFLGGGVRIQELESILKSATMDEIGKLDILNRFGLQTENAGSIQLRLNVVVQNKLMEKIKKKEYRRFHEMQSWKRKKEIRDNKEAETQKMELERKLKESSNSVRAGLGLIRTEVGYVGRFEP